FSQYLAGLGISLRTGGQCQQGGGCSCQYEISRHGSEASTGLVVRHTCSPAYCSLLCRGCWVHPAYHTTDIVNQSLTDRHLIRQAQMNSADNKVLVVVYGTLKRGMCNHHLLSGADFLGEDCLHGITLYDLGP